MRPPDAKLNQRQIFGKRLEIRTEKGKNSKVRPWKSSLSLRF